MDVLENGYDVLLQMTWYQGPSPSALCAQSLFINEAGQFVNHIGRFNCGVTLHCSQEGASSHCNGLTGT